MIHVLRRLVLAHLPGQLGLPQTRHQLGLVGTPEIQTDMRIGNHGQRTFESGRLFPRMSITGTLLA
jgi:hypothetical protein